MLLAVLAVELSASCAYTTARMARAQTRRKSHRLAMVGEEWLLEPAG